MLASNQKIILPCLRRIEALTQRQHVGGTTKGAFRCWTAKGSAAPAARLRSTTAPLELGTLSERKKMGFGESAIMSQCV